MKNKVITLLLLVSLTLSNMTVFASENTGEGMVKSHTFTAREKDATCEEVFENKIKENGSTYKLKSIDYEVVEKKPVIIEKEVEKKIESEYVPEDKEFKPEETITENGVTYKLVDFEMIEEEDLSQRVTGFVDYDHYITAADVPSQKEFPVTNKATGEEEMVICALYGIEKSYSKWVDTYIDITFESYDSVAYEWQGVEVPNNTEHPLQGYEDLLLQSVGGDSTNFRVNDISWKGAEYTVDGVVYRDAVASVQRFVQYYRANYAGDFDPGVKYTVTYKGTEKTESTTEFDYEIIATATYEKAISTVVIAGIGLLLLAALIIFILFILSKKRKEKEKEEGK